jgi:glycosyltransferase involved in cell wall biosynthesis
LSCPATPCGNKDRPLKLVYLCNEYPPAVHGGLGTFTAMLATRMAARGHSVQVLGLYPCAQTERECSAGVAITRLPANRFGTLGFLLNRRRICRELWKMNAASPIDVVEGPELALSQVPGEFPAAKLIRMHGGYHFFSVLLNKKPRFTRAWVERRSFRNSDSLCAVSRFVAAETSRLLGLEHRPVEIIPNPINTDLFQPRPDVGEQPGLAIFAGTLNEKKGICQLIDAVPLVSRAIPNFQLWLVGRDTLWPGTRASFLEKVLSRHDEVVRRRVVHKGPVPNEVLPSLLAQGEVLVFPSHLESQGLVIGEGMAMGKAVVTSQTGPGPELVRHGEDGMLCDPFDPQSIAQELITCFQDANLRRRLGSNARARVCAELSVENLIARNERFYRQISCS